MEYLPPSGLSESQPPLNTQTPLVATFSGQGTAGHVVTSGVNVSQLQIAYAETPMFQRRRARQQIEEITVRDAVHYAVPVEGRAVSGPLHNAVAQPNVALGGHEIVVAPPKKGWAKGVSKKWARKVVRVEGVAVSDPLHFAATPSVGRGEHEIVVLQGSSAPPKKGGVKGLKTRARQVPVRQEDKDEKYWKYRKVNTPAAQKSRIKRKEKENEILQRALDVEQEHKDLIIEVQELKTKVAELERRLSQYEDV